jgi:hypothetical protein
MTHKHYHQPISTIGNFFPKKTGERRSHVESLILGEYFAERKHWYRYDRKQQLFHKTNRKRLYAKSQGIRVESILAERLHGEKKKKVRCRRCDQRFWTYAKRYCRTCRLEIVPWKLPYWKTLDARRHNHAGRSEDDPGFENVVRVMEDYV